MKCKKSWVCVSVSGNDVVILGIQQNLCQAGSKDARAGPKGPVVGCLTGLVGPWTLDVGRGRCWTCWTVLPHPPYSPDLAPFDFHLFVPLKDGLRGQRFPDDGASSPP